MNSFPQRCAAVIVFALISPAGFAANLGIIHGTISEEDGRPIPGVKVSLIARADRPVDEHLTDEKGHFEFEQVPFGQYRLLISAPDGRMDERLVRIASGDVTAVNVTLPTLGENITVTAPTPQAPL